MTDAPRNRQRRAFMRNSLLSIPAVSVGSSLAFRASAAAPEAPPLHDYYPTFFTSEEWQFILSATDLLIPADDTGPGALDAHVPVFIDRELAGGYGQAEHWYMQGPFRTDAPAEMGYQLPHTPAAVYRLGIRATDAHCRRHFSKPFAALDKATRTEVLSALEKGTPDFNALGIANLPSSTFFAFLLQNTREGFLSDPIHGGNRHMVGWKMLGFTGARASFREWVDQYDQPYPLGPVSLNGERG
ncbi:gluconate 2-dehydrogenase subunit 3 family protein [Larsenimonas rhizosphaerae]|uniref:Gluconate 2-dehydrogenase subunit 3 family protein n=1 Tax=Larsenimonas rhizosphaerae TaxID=2944682 RepID=A0AA41ZLB1_9GAMM|nr:gluconate 2-dehydrogenase subunit 3 family protein [Larsenimonas rhizosphaerae]MCM2129530.1 gluconate 2-dehydrogenase subunit 3 family protein [Larsenimonas rhizosphaerae]MCX2524186.1 gluconate 2-dehydrogenase subunit 3 family protein [Larsenimonas rhizosphaerae]